MMKITCISDLHGYTPKLPGGDLLIVAGDLTAKDDQIEWVLFENWLFDQNYKQKILIAGNHDNFLLLMDEHQMWKYWDKIPFVTYLCDSKTEFCYHISGFPEEDEKFLPGGKRTLKIWGTPWTKTFEGMNEYCKAFTCDTEEELAKKFALIPNDIDILISHGPMLHCLDQSIDGDHCGSRALRDVIDRVQPRLFIFGHIHECGGQRLMYKHLGANTWCVNASYVDEKYKPMNKIVTVEI